MALDMHLTPQQRQQGEGTAGDGSISLEELTQASGVRLVRVPPIQTCYRTPGAKRV